MNIIIIGSGFSGLMSAGLLAKEGHHVTLVEKNEFIGGRASSFTADGFHFDKGPSWYWMPDIFENAFARLGLDVNDQFTLEKLDPGFRVYFDEQDYVDIPADFQALVRLFDQIEPGAGEKLEKFIQEAETKYKIGVHEMARFPSLSIFEFASLKVLSAAVKMDLFNSVASSVRRQFTNERLRKIMEFPVLFLGATANNIPALYTMMNYAGLKQGTFYPLGGFAKVVSSFAEAAEKHGVTIRTNAAATAIKVSGKHVVGVEINGEEILPCDVCVGAGDYAHMETLLPQPKRNYSEAYWKSRVFAPSSLLFYLGVDKALPTIEHHSLFFHSDFPQHIDEIYTNKKWPTDPLFYVCRPSKTDPDVAPAGQENLFFLMPLAVDIEDTPELRETYFHRLIDAFERLTGERIKEHICYQRSYCLHDFVSEYNSCRGNAYGLANTLKQTAILKPTMKNKQLKNLFYAGQLSVPGPGVPPAIISGEIVADYIIANQSKIVS